MRSKATLGFLLAHIFPLGLGQSDAITAQCHEDQPRRGTPLTADGLAKIVETMLGGPDDDLPTICGKYISV